jgi:pyrimidine operon attenuation protein/uracil phosphoribosyltransferase
MPFAPDYTGLTVTAGENEKVVVALNAASQKKDSITIRPN